MSADMITHRSRVAIDHASGFICLGAGEAALASIDRLEPIELETGPGLWLRMRALAADRWRLRRPADPSDPDRRYLALLRLKRAIELGRELLDIFVADAANAGPLPALTFHELGVYYAAIGVDDRARKLTASGASLFQEPILEIADNRVRALWEAIAAADCPRIEPDGWPANEVRREKSRRITTIH